MSNPTIQIDLEVNGEKALQSISNFKKDADEKLSSIGKIEKSFAPAVEQLNSDKSLLGSGEAFDSFANSIMTANNAIAQMRKTLNSFSSSIDLGNITDGMTRMFESAYRTMLSSIKTLNAEVDRGLSKGPKNINAYTQAEKSIKLASVTGQSASADMIRMLRIVNNAHRETGLNADQLGEIMPALSSIVRAKTDEYRKATKSTPRLSELANFIANEDIFKNTVGSSIKGYNPTQQQLAQIAKGAIVATRSNAYRDNLEILKAAGLKGSEYQYVTDQMPEVFKKAYINYGRPNSSKETNIIAKNIGKQAVDEEVYKKFMQLVRNGNQQAIKIGQDVGLVRARNGSYQFTGNARKAQFDTMAGIVAQVAGEAKSSLPYHYIQRNDQTQQQKLLNRNNNIFNDALELMEILSGQSGLDPNAYGYVPFGTTRESLKNYRDLFGFVGSGKNYRRFNKNAPKIQTLGVANQYVVPKTHLDQNGNLVWRDPSWQKTNGVQESKDDQFATIGNSALTYLLGMHGHNTYGYGRTDEGEANYQTPKVVRISTSHLYKQIREKNGTRMIVDPEKQTEADRINRLFARKETAHYTRPGEKENDDNEYIAAMGDAESLTMIRKKDYDAIVSNFAKYGMANPFDNMNTGGLFISGDYKNAAKQIDLSKKKATPGFRYAELGYAKSPSAALVDFEQLYEYLGIPKNNQFMRQSQRLDGLALFDPSVLGVNAQMRAGIVGKFMGQATDWRKLLYESGILESAYKKATTGDKRNSGLIVKNGSNGVPQDYSFYMPMVGLEKEEAQSYIDRINELQRKANNGPISEDEKNELERIRNTYFYDIMDKKYDALIAESTIKNNDKYRIISKNAFTNKDGLFRGEKWVKDRGDGTVELSADQQRRYFEAAVKESGGYWINKTGYDFRTDKDFIPESLATAMGLEVGDLKDQSNENYNEYIHKLETDKNARINFLNTTAYGRRLVQEGLYDSDLADRLIRSHINDYASKQQQGHLFLPQYGIDNLLTGVLPGSIFGNIFEQGFDVKVSDNNDYRKLFSYQGDEDRVFMKTLNGKQQEALRNNAIAAKLMLSRMPAGPGEYGIGVQNLGDIEAMQKALDALGVDYSDTIFTDPSLQYKLMTGDYDGDTAWVIRGLNDNQFARMQQIQDYVQRAREKIMSQMDTASPEEKKRLENDLQAFTNFGADHFTAQIGMGQATAAIRNSLADLSDNDPDKWIAIAEAIDAYDKNTSEAMKEGKIVNLGVHASKQAMEGGLFRRFIKQINAYGQGSENAHPDLFATRLPEIQDTGTLFDIVSNFRNKRNGSDVGKRFGSDLDSWLFEQYGYSNSFEAQAARAYADMFKNIEGGIRLTSKDDISNARLIAVRWQNSLEKDRKANRDPEALAEEQHRLNQFVKRLHQVETSGSLHEDFLAQTEELENERTRLIKSGVTEDDKRIIGLDKKIGLYKTLTSDLSLPFQIAKENWETEQKEMDEEVRKRYEANLALAKTNNVNMTNGVMAMLGPALSTDLVKAGKINFSDVTPWLYENLAKDQFRLKGIEGFEFNENGEMVRDKLPKKTVDFFPWPHNVEGIKSQKAEILAREMDTRHEWVPGYSESIATIMGKIRHESFEEALLQYAKGETADIAKIYEGMLTAADSSTSSPFRKLGYSLKRDEKTGVYTVEGADNSINEGIRGALGTWNEKTQKYEGGSLSNLYNYITSNGYRVANIEGFNINKKGEKMNSRETVPDDYFGRGTVLRTKIKSPTGEEIDKVGTFAPDLILQGKDGKYHMLDYKSGEQGAYDSLYQMMIYAADIQEKVQQFRNSGQRAEAKKLGWDQYLDNKGNLKFGSVFGFDTQAGKGYKFSFSQDAAQELSSRYKESIQSKLFASDEELVSAQRRLVAEVAKKYGIEQEHIQKKSTEEAVRGLTKDDARGSWYSNYLADKFNKDEDTLREISSTGYAAIRRYGDREVGGYSKYASSRRMLDEMIDPETIDQLIGQAKEKGDSGAILSLLEYQQKINRARETLNQGELLAAQNSFKDINSYIQEQFFGVKESKPLAAFNAVRKRILDAESIREGLKENKDVYDAVNQKWLNDEYRDAYIEAGKDKEIALETFDSLLPDFKNRAIKENNKNLQKLISNNNEPTAEDEIEQYYQNRYDALEQYVKQQEHDLDEYSKKLAQKDDKGQLVLKHGSKARQIFEELRDNSHDNLIEAFNALNNTSALEEVARTEYEKSIGLVGGERAKKRSDKQREYLDKIKKEYDETRDENLNPLRQELYEAELSGDTEKYNKIRKKLDKIYKDTPRRRKKMQEYAQFEEEQRMQKEIEDTEDQLKRGSIDRLYSGKGMSEEDSINAIFLQRKKQAQEYAATLDKDAREEFWKTHQDDTLKAQIKQEITESKELQDLQRENARLNLVDQGDVRVRNMRHQFDRQNRQQQMRYSRSRIVQAMYGAEQRRDAKEQEIQNIEDQRKSIQRQQNYYAKELELAKKSGDEERINKAQFNYDQTAQQLQNLDKASKEAKDQLDQLNNGAQTAQAVFGAFGQTLGMVASRLGRRLFQKTLQETKQFIKQFDASMNEIQTITLKSDKEMQGIRSQTINKALGLRTSVSNVSNVEAALYRQGLSDQEVSARTDSIIKFATVTKLNVQEATKIITTALQNDLVASANEAMDALVALGDNAATTAAEIGKGMQKAAASAKVAGVSYAELTALLTIGTSDTQLSGTQVGTALQTVFSRMRRMSVSGWTADQNGKKTTASDAEAALASVGVDLWDNKAIGKMRTAYDVLLDLSKVWQNLSDAQKNIVMNAMAGTRQTNVFSTLMEGMSEDSGATLEKYLGLAEGSEGITQSKYEIAMQSLSAAMDKLKSSWDAVVESFTNAGAITGAIDLISGFLQKIADVASSDTAGQIGLVTGAIISGIAGIAATCIAAKTAVAPIASLIGLLIGGGIAIASGLTLSSLFEGKSEDELLAEQNQQALSNISSTRKINDATVSDANKAIDKVKEAGKEWEKLDNGENTDNLKVALQNLADIFPNVSSAVKESITDLSKWSDVVKEAKEKVDQFATTGQRDVVKKTLDYIDENLYGDYVLDRKLKISSLEGAQEAESEFKKAYYGKGSSVLYNSNNDLFSGIVLDVNPDKLLSEGTKEEQAIALTEAYRNNPNFAKYAKPYLNSEVINQLDNKSIERPYDSDSFVEWASGGLVRILNDINANKTRDDINAAAAFLSKSYKDEDSLNRFANYISENGEVIWDKFNTQENTRENALMFAQLASGSKVLQSWIGNTNPEVRKNIFKNGEINYSYLNENEEIISNLAKEYANDQVNSTEYAARRSASRTFLKEKLPEVLADDFAMMANDRFSAEDVQTLFLRGLESEIKNNPDLINADGNYDTEALKTFVSKFLNSWLDNTSSFLNEYVAEYGDYRDFAYHINEKDSNTWFNDYDKAVEYARTHNVKFDEIKDKNGNVAYQTNRQLLSAKQQEANANNRQNLLKNIIYGYNEGAGFNLLTEAEQREIAKDKARSLIGHGMPVTEKDIISMTEDLSKKASEQGIETYGSIYKLEQAAKEGGWDADLANAISGNSNAMAAYLANDYDALVKSLQEEIVGKSTPQSRADLMRSFGSMFSGNRAAVESFRKEGLTSDAYKQWQSFFGDNADLILDELAAGTLEQNKALYDEYRRILAEKGLKIGTGKMFTGVETTGLAQQILSGGFKDWAEAQEKMTEWTTDEWSALESKYPALKQYMQMTEEQRNSQEGQNLLRNVKIQMSVSGISDLEEAGKIAEGTATELEKLQKGGHIAIEVLMQYRTEAFENKQKSAKLYNGTMQEQDEAAMSVLNMSEEQYYANRQANLELARRTEQNDRKYRARTWQERYENAATKEQADEILRDAKLEGYAYVKNGDYSEYKIPAGYTVDEFGNVYDKNGNFSDTETLKREASVGHSFIHSGTGSVTRNDYFGNKEALYTNSQLASWAEEILKGDLTANTKDRENEYTAAAAKLGEYSVEYLRMLDLNKALTEAGEEPLYDETALAEAKQMADAEVQKAKENAAEQDALKEAELNNISLSGAFAYQQLQRRQQNKGAYAAERLFTSLNDKTVNNFDDLLDVVGSADANDWKDFIESSSDLSNKLADMGVKIGEDGFDFSDLEKNGYEAADVLKVLKEAASEASNGLKGFKEVLTTGQETARAEEFIGGEVTDENYKAFEAFIGNNEVAQIAKNYAVQYKADKQLYDEYQGLTNTSDRAAWLINHNNKEPTNPGEFDLFGQYEGYNRDYVEALYDNALLGKQGLTDADRLRMFEGIMNDVGQGTSVEQIRKSNNTGFYSDVLSGVNGGEDYLQMIEILNGKGLDFKQFKGIEETSDEFQQLQAAFEGTDYSANQFLLTSEEIDNELRSNAISTYKLFGKETEKVNGIYKKLNGTVEEQLEARKEMTRHKLDLSNATYYTSGKGAGNYKKVAKDFLEYSDKDIKAMESQLGKEGAKIEIQKQAELKFEFSQQQIQNDLNAIIQDTITDLGSDFNVDALNLNLNGTYDISQLRALAAEATGQTKAILDSILAELAGMEGQVTFQATTDGKSIKIASSNLKSVGGGKPTGGGGGGGGKTATDKLLEQQKRRVAQVEHEGKILEIYGKGYDFLNDYDAQMTNIDDQIANQRKLRDVYEQNIAEMQAQLAVVERGSDDWFKLAEAINAARESMASIQNTINELNTQKIQILEQKLEYEKSPNAHKSNLLEKFAQRYQVTDRHEAYVAAQKKMIKTTEDRIKINENAIKHWEDLLDKTVKESDAWYSIRDKIWGLQEENEGLKTDIVNAKIELEQTKADQMAKDIQDSIAASQHESDILGVYLDAFQTTNQFDKYREALTTIGTNLQLKKAAQNSLIDDLRKQADKKLQEIEKAESADKRDEENIAILKKQYEVYVNAIREAELEAAQTDVDVLTNRQAIEESYITEIQRKNEPREKALEHQSKMLELYMRKYQTDKNYYYQEELLSQTADLTSEKIDLQKEKLQSLLDLQNSGQITEGSQQWYDLQDAIYATTEAIVELESSMNDLAQLNFDHIVQMFKEGTTDLYSAVVGDKKFFGNNNTEIQEQISSYIAEKQDEYTKTEDIFSGLKTNKEADMQAIKDEYNPQIEEAKAAYDAAVEKTKPYEEAKAALDKFDADKQAALNKAEADYKAQIKEINSDKSLKKAQKDKKKAAAKKKWEAEKKKINKTYSSAKRKPLKTEVDKYADLEAFLPDKDTTKAKYNDLVSERDYLLGLENERLETIEDNKQTALAGIQEALSVFADYLDLERDENGNIKTDENGNIDYAHSNIDADAISNVVSALIESSLVGTDQLQHERNLIGYQQTKYQNRGELTNVGRMMEYDREVMDEMYAETELQIDAWKEYAETVRDNPEMFAKATDKIREQEEVLAKLTVEIEKNTDAQEKNTEAIRQARIKAENELDKAIRAIIQKQRNMLAATVQIQNAILDTIRNSYREQWDLEKKTIDKKKQALVEEKNLISERLNFRKKMMDQESKDEELAEYKRQLALISADTTRTKEANELRRKIAEMEKDKALQDAQDIASAEISALDDQTKAWDTYASNKEEDLNTFLSDANNFIDTLDELMSGSFEDFVAWNAEYNTSYKKSTAEQKEQMEQGWDDTWLNMLGLLRTYWDEVDESMRSKDAFMSVVTSQDDYIKRSDTDKESFRWNMSEIYDAFTNSLIDNAEFSDTHEIINKIDDLKDWTFDVKISNPEDYVLDPNYSNYIYERSRAKLKNYDIKFNEYKGWGIDAPPPTPLPDAVDTDVPSTGGNGGSGGPGGPTPQTQENHGYEFYYNGIKEWSDTKHNSQITSKQVAFDMAKKKIQIYVDNETKKLITDAGLVPGSSQYIKVSQDIGRHQSAALQSIKYFKFGGLVNYTGPAWVDGTKTRPEAFLNADDTALLRAMLDEFTYVKNTPYMTQLDTAKYGNTNVSVGDINVNLYEAKLESDADYDLIAQKVGNAFTKQLQKDGFNLAGYAW